MKVVGSHHGIHFQGRAVSFREGNSTVCPKLPLLVVLKSLGKKTEVYNGQIEVRKRVTKRGFLSGIFGDTLNLEDGKQWYFV